MRPIKLRIVFLFTLAFCAGLVKAQPKKLTLLDLSDFKPQAGNWFIVGDVTVNPDEDSQGDKDFFA